MDFDTPRVMPGGQGSTTLPIRFTGSGSEYFRIWIVNLLLIVVTLGLYLPFAKRRRIAYFYANTEVGGHVLAFHGDPWRMFRGFVLLGVLMLVYGASNHFSPMVGALAFMVLCALWPALWRAGLQFRLANTSWRGLRMGFSGSLGGAYRTVLPIYLPLILTVVLGALATPAEGAPPGPPPGGLWLALLPLLSTVAVPWVMAASKRYQHDGYRLGTQRSHISLSTGATYGLFFRASLIGLAVAVVVGLVLGLAAGVLGASLGGLSRQAVIGGLIGVGMVVAYVAAAAVSYPYFAARWQDLVWNGTRSPSLSFHSRLGFKALLGLTLKNWLLTALTLGLYRPFAVVATTRMRLQAVEVLVDGDPEALLGEAGDVRTDAVGEAAGDFFGIDLGL